MKKFNHLISRFFKHFWLLTSSIFLLFNSAKAQYCETGLGGGGCHKEGILGVEIVGTNLLNMDNDCNGRTGNMITIFPAAEHTFTDLQIGSRYKINVKCSNFNYDVAVWIDYNHNFVFDSVECVRTSCMNCAFGTIKTLQVDIPITAYSGYTRMRVRNRSGTVTANDACSNFISGDTEDYTVNLLAPSPCGVSEIYDRGQICTGEYAVADFKSTSYASGLTYQWQSSLDSTNWVNLPNGTGLAVANNQSQNTYYRCITTCPSTSDTSNVVKVEVACYCPSKAIANNNFVNIARVRLGSADIGSSTPVSINQAATSQYTNNTATVGGNLVQAKSYELNLNFNYSVPSYVDTGSFVSATAFVDFNHDQVFDSISEIFPLPKAIVKYKYYYNISAFGGWGGYTRTSYLSHRFITIPDSAQLGETRIRFIAKDGNTVIKNPCGNYPVGETEDYIFNIVASPACTVAPNAGNVYSPRTGICYPEWMLFNLVGNSTGVGQTYQWQTSSDSVNWVSLPGETEQFLNYFVSATSYFRVVATCSGISSMSPGFKVYFGVNADCYCSAGELVPPSYENVDIGSFSIGSFINSDSDTSAYNNPYAVNSYSDFTSLTPINLGRGIRYPVNLLTISDTTYANNIPGQAASLFIDFNQNSKFDIFEFFNLSRYLNAHPNFYDIHDLTTTGLLIPYNAKLGITRMRISVGNMKLGQGCGKFEPGEVEDYLVNITLGTGADDITTQLGLILVYPNPASETLTITRQDNGSQTQQLVMYAISGQKVFEDKLGSNYSQTLDVSNFPKGMYILQVISESDVITRKVILK